MQPQRTPGGHRLYNDEDLKQVQRILLWLKKGVSIGQVKPLPAGDEHDYTPEVQPDKLWVLVTAGPLTQARRHQLDAWLTGGLQVVAAAP